MPIPAGLQAIIDRLASFYNGNAYNPTSNPGGFARGGNQQGVFIAFVRDVAGFGQGIVTIADDVEAARAEVAQNAGAAEDSADAAFQSEQNAADSATAAAAQAARLQGTSTTSQTPAIGSKTFTTQPGKAFDVGNDVRVQSRADINRWMTGRVTAYAGGSVAVLVDAIGSVVTAAADWDIRVAGTRGAQGDQGPQGTNRIVPEARTSNTALAVADNAKLIDITSGTFAQTFVAAATLGAGWQVQIRNSGIGTITLDPNGSETIDGATTLALGPGETRQVICTGAGFVAVRVDAPVPAAGLVFVSEQTVTTAVTSADFTGLTSAYDEYLLEILNAVPTTASLLRLRTSSNGGASFDAGASDYRFTNCLTTTSAVSVGGSSGGASSIHINGATNINTSASLGGASGSVRIVRPASAAEHTHVTYKGQSVAASDTLINIVDGGGARVSADDVDAIRIFFEAGNIASGSFKLYGMRKS